MLGLGECIALPFIRLAKGGRLDWGESTTDDKTGAMHSPGRQLLIPSELDSHPLTCKQHSSPEQRL